MEMRRKRLQRGGLYCFCFGATGRLILCEPEAIKPTNKFTFYRYFAGITYVSHHGLLLAEPAKQN